MHRWAMEYQVQVRYILSKKSSAQMGIRVNPVLAWKSCIQCYISLLTEIILQHFDAFKIEIQGTLSKLWLFKASRGQPSKVVKIPIMSPGAEDMEYFNNWWLCNFIASFCKINGHIWLSSILGITVLIVLCLWTEFAMSCLEIDVGKSHEIAFSMTVQRDFQCQSLKSLLRQTFYWEGQNN